MYLEELGEGPWSFFDENGPGPECQQGLLQVNDCWYGVKEQPPMPKIRRDLRPWPFAPSCYRTLWVQASREALCADPCRSSVWGFRALECPKTSRKVSKAPLR